jgi:hypothetical protein
MSSPLVDAALFHRLLQADELGIRLEIVGGLPLWEASPVRRHQQAIDRIRASLRPAPQGGDGCGSVHFANVYIAFPDGSLKRPDISIFCREPDEEDEAITLLPEAVIEVISRGYEAKDLEIGSRFYLHTLLVLHLTPTTAERLVSPVDLTLACGYACRV